VTGCCLLYAFHVIINVMYAAITMEIQMRFHFTSGWKKAAFTKCDCMVMTMMILWGFLKQVLLHVFTEFVSWCIWPRFNLWWCHQLVHLPAHGASGLTFIFQSFCVYIIIKRIFVYSVHYSASYFFLILQVYCFMDKLWWSLIWDCLFMLIMW